MNYHGFVYFTIQGILLYLEISFEFLRGSHNDQKTGEPSL